MSRSVVTALLIVGSVYLLRAPLRQALAVLLGVTILVPGFLLVPGIRNGHFLVHRVILVVFCINLARRLLRGEIPGGIGRPTRVHFALLAFVALTFFVGVVVGGRDLRLTPALFTWSFILEQFVFYAAVVITFRAIGDPMWIARLVAAVLVANSLIGVVEHFTGWSYGRWWLRKLQPGSLGSIPLRERGGNVRVRAGLPFSLAYTWVTIFLLPILVAAASRSRRFVVKLLPAMVIMTIIWTYSRSAYSGLALVAVVLVLASRLDARITGMVAVGAFAGAILVVSTGVWAPTFSSETAIGSSLLREQRLPFVLGEAAERPFTGVGSSGLAQIGLRSTDAGYLRLYAEFGALGIVGFVVLMIIVLASVAPALRAPPGTDRALAAGVVAGLGSTLLGPFFLDQFGSTTANRSLWILVALGAVLAERAGGLEIVPARRLARRMWIPALGVGLGALISAVMPTSYAAKFQFQTVPEGFDIAGTTANAGAFSGKVLLNTACLIMDGTARNLPDASVGCFDLRTRTGLGEVRVETRNRARALNRVRVILAHARATVPGFRSYLVEEIPSVKPTLARTAPVWLGGAGLAAAFVIPFRRRGRADGTLPAPPFPAYAAG